MNLRARVVIGAAGIAVVLAIAAVVTIRTTHDHLVDQVDTQLASAGNPARDFVGGGGGPPGGPGGDRGPGRLSTFFVGIVVDEGEIVIFDLPNATGEELAAPLLTAAEATANATGDPFTVGSVDGGLEYRVRATVDRDGHVLVLGLPLTDVDNAVDRLIAVELAAVLAVLAVVALTSWWVVHLGIRPLKRMTATATAIAAGDLSARVPDANPATEAGELGIALNRMLGAIEASMERQRRFAADASHELRTPVTTIRGYAELYRAGGLPPGPELDEAMRRTEQEALRMGGLIEDLLRLARLDQSRSLTVEPVDLRALVDDAARDARAVAPDRDVTASTPAGEPLVVSGDEDRLRQVIANVVGNALVHTAAGTPIEIAASRVDGRARVDVIDHGAGMAPEVAARAFERFYRADPSRSRHRGGSGLGLSIVEATVGAHGGTVAIDSAPGRGTTVRIELPFEQDAGGGR